MLTYRDVQPRATQIKGAVLGRRMPPWGAVKGFGSFRNDESLSQEQIELITKWVDGGISRGNNPGMLTAPPAPKPAPTPRDLRNAVRVTGPFRLDRAMTLDGLLPEQVPANQSIRIIAVLPTGRVEPLLWLHDYDTKYAHPFLFRRPIQLPAGTAIQGVPPSASIVLIPG